MKFEANIPSYLRTGQGVFPVKGRVASKTEKETNFFKLMEKGVNMPVSNEVKGSESALLGSPGMNEPMSEGNFLEKMQDRMSETTIKPEIPVVRPEKMPEPTTMMEVRAENEEDQDIIIG